MTDTTMHKKYLSILTILALTSALFCTVASRAETTSDASPWALPHTNFNTADADQNGALDLEEFTVFVKANAEANFGKAKRIKRFGAYKRALKKVDEDKNGAVTWQEFLSAQK